MMKHVVAAFVIGLVATGFAVHEFRDTGAALRAEKLCSEMRTEGVGECTVDHLQQRLVLTMQDQGPGGAFAEKILAGAFREAGGNQSKFCRKFRDSDMLPGWEVRMEGTTGLIMACSL